ncbi:MAG TPA: hypothetical protein PLS24_01920, partial [Sedimentisphaerales bacterium]|nr:hypothetical protein [Sedimentisphaerales bacterium]
MRCVGKTVAIVAVILFANRMLHGGASEPGAAGKVVPRDVMERIYEQVKTPYKYGVILTGENGANVDCPSVFRHGDRWYMLYNLFAGKGYETLLAESED